MKKKIAVSFSFTEQHTQICMTSSILIGVMLNVITEAVCVVFMAINIHARSIWQKTKRHQKSSAF